MPPPSEAFHGGGTAVPRNARALLSDGETAALVAADGTIDWWCPNRFDGDAAFYRILDPAGGALRVGPVVPAGGPPPRGVQRYDGDSHTVRTSLNAGEAEVEITDLLPWRGVGHRADGRIVRIVTAMRGPVDVEVAVQPANRWRAARDVHGWSGGIAFDGIVVRSGCDMTGGRRGTLRLAPGEPAVVTIDVEPIDGSPLPELLSVDAAIDLVDRTRTAWSSRLLPLAYDGPYTHEVRRSLLVVLGLTYTPVGTVIASPERDGRHASLRDASVFVAVCRELLLRDEAHRTLSWLSDVLRWSDLPMRATYAVDGTALEEGDAALRLDIYGDLASVLTRDGLDADDSLVRAMWRDVLRLGEWLAETWHERDAGEWRVRRPRQLVTSKLACWAALERIATLEATRNVLSLDAAALRMATREVLAWIEGHGLGADGGLRSDTSEADLVDASLLSVAWQDPWPHEPWRAGRTVDRVLRRLGDGPFVRAYDQSFDDESEPEPGASVPGSFGAVEALAALGRWDEAHDRMEQLCSLGAPLGLLPERVDVDTARGLGDRVLARSHLAFIRAAMALSRGPR